MASVQPLVTRGKLALERARARHAWVDVAVRTATRFSQDEAGLHAASLTYYMFFSLFPMLMFSTAVLGYFFSDAIREQLLNAGLSRFPMLQEALTEHALTTIEKAAGTLALAALALAVYAGTGGITALIDALNHINRVKQERNFVTKRLVALRWLALFAVGAFVSVALGAAARFAGAAASLVAFVSGAAVDLLMFLTAFTLLPNTDVTWRRALPGACMAAAGFQVLKYLGGVWLAAGADTRSATFGTFVGAATLLVVSYLLSQVTLLAAELNAVLDERRWLRRPGGTEKEGV